MYGSIKLMCFVFPLLISGITLAQGKSEQTQLLEQYASLRKTYDSLTDMHARHLTDLDKTSSTYRELYAQVNKEFQTIYVLRGKVVNDLIRLEKSQIKPNGIQREQIDTIQLYKAGDVEPPDWSLIELFHLTYNVPLINWQGVPKKRLSDSLRQAFEELENSNAFLLRRSTDFIILNQQFALASNQLNQLKEYNYVREQSLIEMGKIVGKQLPADYKLGGYNSQEEPPPPPAPVEEEIFTVVDEPADFPGGMTALKSYLQEAIVYPESAKKAKIEGNTYLKFVVSKHGNISNVSVQRGVPDCPECDQEAMRVVKSMPKWTSAKIGGKAVHSWYNLPVKFELP